MCSLVLICLYSSHAKEMCTCQVVTSTPWSNMQLNFMLLRFPFDYSIVVASSCGAGTGETLDGEGYDTMTHDPLSAAQPGTLVFT